MKFTKKGIVKKVLVRRLSGKIKVRVLARRKGTTYMYIRLNGKKSDKVKIRVR